MIVCLCRRVSDRDIRRAVQQGVDNFETLQDDTGVASHCGCCHDCAREVFDEARNACGRPCGAAVVHGPTHSREHSRELGRETTRETTRAMAAA